MKRLFTYIYSVYLNGTGMGPSMNSGGALGRRRFLMNSPAWLGLACLSTRCHGEGPGTRNVSVISEPGAGFLARLAANELVRGLRQLGFKAELRSERKPATGAAHALTLELTVRRQAFRQPDAYEIRTEGERVHLTGASGQALQYSVSDFLERQGVFFGLDGEVYPLDAPSALARPESGQVWTGRPRFSTRGLLPFPDFLNCISVYNREEYRAMLEAMARMRLNTLFMFCHTSGNQPFRVWNNESFLSFDYGGVGHWSGLQTTSTFFDRWGYLPQRTSQYGMGAADFFAGEVFGADSAIKARNPWEEQELTRKVLNEAFRYAHQLGIRVVMGFEVYSVPYEIVRAAPPEARLQADAGRSSYYARSTRPTPPLDPESVAAKDILEARLASLLEAYPDVDYVSLWQDEATNFETRQRKMEFPVTPFKQAYDFLRRHAPKVRMLVSGWGGITRKFPDFHKLLPEDVIFSALSDSLGWDPVSPEYAKLGTRERWPIPWLEDDASMWFPQFHVRRWHRDMEAAQRYGCQGVIGIHWRTRIIDANAGFLSRGSWQKSLQPEEFYNAFSNSLVRAPRAQKLAGILNDADRDRLLADSLAEDEIKSAGFNRVRGFSADYNDGFQPWRQGVSEKTKASQAKVAAELRALTQSASSPAEYERLNYLARQVEFLVPYADSWSTGFTLQNVLAKAAELKKAGKLEEAHSLVRAEGVPLWLKMAPRVRKAILDFQEVVSTWNDIGTVASLHNKYERVALFRLPASMKEYLRELPAPVSKGIADARKPDQNGPARIFIPTRPSLLRRGEKIRLLAVIQGGRDAEAPILFTRNSSAKAWSQTTMKPAGRRTFVGELAAPATAGPYLDYYVSARIETMKGPIRTVAPPEAPARPYGVTIVG